MPAILQLIAPDFLLIGLGWLLLHYLHFPADFFRSLEKLVYYVLFPALLFSSLTQTQWSLSEASWLLLAVLTVILCAVGLSWLAQPFLKPDARSMGSIAQCGFRFNTYLGLSLAQAIGGAQGAAAMALLVGFGVPLCNMAAVSGLARGQGKRRMFRAMAKNPLILATLLGMIWNLGHLPIPGPFAISLSRLGACALGIGLLCVGATLSLQGARAHQKLIIWINAVKLLAMPALALLLAYAMQLNLIESQMLLLYCALPTASSAHVLAAQMQGDAKLVALTMSLGTLSAILTIPLWLHIFNWIFQ